MFFIGCLLPSIGYGGMASLCACLVRALLGAKNYSFDLSIISLQMIPASIIGPILGSRIYETHKNYTTVCLSFLVFGLIGIPLGYSKVNCCICRSSVPWNTSNWNSLKISGLLQQPQNQGKTEGLAACNSQPTSPLSRLNNFY